ncbi:MAG TPA: glycoside hydrolase family 6 protein [Polyangiaceae bacterium]|nr:glycoside hydrolase family 6 protein [Polyangiaceae bacterium]
MTKSMFVYGAILGGAFAVSGCGGAGSDGADEGQVAKANSALSGGCKLDNETRFYVPPPDPGAVKQIAALIKAHDLKDAARLTAMVTTPQAVWFTGGTPKEVEKSVKQTIAAAALEKRVPVLVAYNVPFRDCAQYSGGGAVDTAAYKAWIDAFAKGIGSGKAVVILEPDSLGIIPYNTTIYGAEEWCKPTVTGADGSVTPAPGASPTERYAQLQYAASSLGSRAPNTSVYLDGTHAAWLGVGEAAYRIHKAGTDPVSGNALAKGFYVNASNFQTTEQSIQFSTWVSMCTAFATNPDENGWRLGNFAWCASQYNPATGYTVDYTPEYVASVTAQIQGMMGSAVATLPFVVDTSRNGRGTLDVTPYAAAPYNQPESVISGLKNGNWCNPPGAGLGLRPSATTGVALLDAYLWVKTPGQSDGSCDIAGGARAWDYSQYNPWALSGDDAQKHFDPLWGRVDPAAGAWFPAQALELAKNATPPLF